MYIKRILRVLILGVTVSVSDSRIFVSFVSRVLVSGDLGIDHNSLQYLLQQKTLSTAQQKWIEKIATFDMEILHKRGKDNVVVDSLSRKDEEVKAYAISVADLDWLDEIRGEYAKDPDTRALINDPNQGTKLEWRNDILWYKGRIYLSTTSRFKTKVLKESHESPAARFLQNLLQCQAIILLEGNVYRHSKVCSRM